MMITRLAADAARRGLRRPPPGKAAWCRSRCMGTTSTGGSSRNPFEVQFDDATEKQRRSKTAIDNLRETPVTGTLEDEINLFHNEMASVFGSEPAEYMHDDDTQSSRGDDGHPNELDSLIHAPTALKFQKRGVPIPSLAGAPAPPSSIASPHETTAAGVVLIQGPCTYVHQAWVGSPERWSDCEVRDMVIQLASQHGISVSQHHSNHEGRILDWLLNTSPGDKIILNWNGRLADSPIIYRALSSIRAYVVILTPVYVELGPVPPSVKGVIAGFGTRALELAILACK